MAVSAHVTSAVGCFVVKLQSVLLKEMITAQDLKVILESDEFGNELEELSSYAANILWWSNLTGHETLCKMR